MSNKPLKENRKNSLTKFKLDQDSSHSFWKLSSIDKENANQVNNPNCYIHKAFGLCLQKILQTQTKPNIQNNYYYYPNLENLKDNILPFERNPTLNFINKGKENYYNLQKNFSTNEDKKDEENELEEKFKINREKIFSIDIPEMILYKYNYDIELLKNSLDNQNITEEAEWIYEFLKSKFNQSLKNEIINCIKDILIKHKKERTDIFLLIKQNFDHYSLFFTQDDIINILSLYEVEFIKFSHRKNKLLQFINEIPKFSNDLIKEELIKIKNDTELFLVKSYIGCQMELDYNNIDKKYRNLFHPDIFSNKKILNIAIEYGCDKMINQFFLPIEDVVNNMKILLKEKEGKLKEPNHKGSFIQLCIDKIGYISKRIHPSELFILCLNYYTIILASNYYISKKIYEIYRKITTISTKPTEKGEIYLNSQHPWYKCKRINKCPLDLFLNSSNKDFSELYLDIENCVDEELIILDINIDLSN